MGGRVTPNRIRGLAVVAVVGASSLTDGGGGAMPAFNGRLTPTEIEDGAAFVFGSRQ